ncbi:MAG: hypothetical protein COT71_02515 [Candidatus Andersenbacteria bacterium CG10_big_fil_rev_8_21_14_0_10_54_11]|uniref:Gfo/Idh/MocA-like oxidoreductase N-terminal domain-containing protein n=1 Tax=Candidatus Andersenbacteria bacterium CG10_big_fil_rev_8_21_14_0_10_54_11 TaxID=1974485 RepID=A0A2M6WZ79_9BACT|nr:MAG: hypothetical protein COT71_02515 [Candidatus Andersenbacteria bacterium CG10_big_fil_rev_8_21_14_0_10_54_11]
MAVRVGIIGAGRRAVSVYKPALAAAEGLSVAAVADIDERAAHRLADAFGAVACASSQALLQMDVDGVIVAVPPRLKDAISLTVLEAGKHLFVESPAAQSAGAVRRLAQKARQRNLTVEVAEDEAFWPAAVQHRADVAAGRLGRVVAVHNDCREFYYHAYARLHILLGTLPRPLRYGGWQAALPSGGRVTWRAVQFADGLVYTQRFIHPREHSAAVRPRWIVAGERGTLIDAQSTEQHIAGLRYLLEQWLAAQHGRGTAAYGLGKAEEDIAIWQGLEAAARLPLRNVSAQFAERLADSWIAVRQRFTGN